MKPSIGRIVHYVLDEQDAEEINRRRIDTDAEGWPDRCWPPGAQAHVGDSAIAGQHLPLMICAVEDHAGVTYIRGQVFAVGNDVLWVWGIVEGTGPGFWHWPERIEE